MLRPDQLLKFPTREALLDAAAALFVQSCAAVPDASVNLTGGSTIGALYQRLAQSDAIDWPRLWLSWGDERFVPRGHPDHNASAARRVLLDHVPVTQGRVLEIPTDLPTPEACAEAYAARLALLERPGRPLFDLTLLSLGDDGHIASLLPGQPVLEEATRLVAAVPHGRPEARISLTYPALRRSARLLLIVVGAAKAPVLRALLAGAEDYPASKLAVDGELLVLADAAALG